MQKVGPQGRLQTNEGLESGECNAGYNVEGRSFVVARPQPGQ